LGKRTQKSHPVPHNVSYVLLGTALLWFGWFGFNGGSALRANSQAVTATLVTHLAACAGGITGLVLNYCRSRTYSAVGFCSGAVAGLGNE
jgi:Amt family ammonium transporter